MKRKPEQLDKRLREILLMCEQRERMRVLYIIIAEREKSFVPAIHEFANRIIEKIHTEEDK